MAQQLYKELSSHTHSICLMLCNIITVKHVTMCLSLFCGYAV